MTVNRRMSHVEANNLKPDTAFFMFNCLIEGEWLSIHKRLIYNLKNTPFRVGKLLSIEAGFSAFVRHSFDTIIEYSPT